MDESDGSELVDDDGERVGRMTVASSTSSSGERELQNGSSPTARQEVTTGRGAPRAASPSITDETAARIARTLERGPYVDGPATAAFEASFARHQGVDHAVAVDSGTSALFVALRAAGVGPGDDVFVPAYGPFTTVSVVLTLGARPVFVDANPATYTMGVFTLERAIETASNPTAVVPVHVHGQPSELHGIAGLARQHDLTLVEDARPALGASYQGEQVGSIGDVGCFSFDPTRPMTVGGNGGMAVTDDDELADEIRVLRDKGQDRNGVRCRAGLNHQLEEVSAVVGQDQLERLSTATERRREIAMRYRTRLASLPRVRLPTTRRDAEHAYGSFIVHVPDRSDLAATLEDDGIPTYRPHPVPSARHPTVRARLESEPDVRYADRLCEQVLALPFDSTTTDAEVDAVCAAIEAHYS